MAGSIGKKRILKITLGLVFIFVAALVVMMAWCVTFPKRDKAFEQKIERFVQDAISGSEIALFSGSDLGGWEVHGLGRWQIKEGVLISTRGLGYLATRCKSFSDFILTCDIRVSDQGNSGIFFRAKHPGWGLRPWPYEYEAQVDQHDPRNFTGSLYKRKQSKQLLTHDNQWFTMRISAIGPTIEIQLNGETAIKIEDETYQQGFIALQAHHFSCTVEFKNILLRIPD